MATGGHKEMSPRSAYFMQLRRASQTFESGGEVGQASIILTKDMSQLAHFPTGEEAQDSVMRKSKIVCTMGPKCWDAATLVKLIDAGMNIARLNFSHGDHKTHSDTVARIREANKARPEKYVAVMLDTKGPEIRTGFLKDKNGVQLVAGNSIVLDTSEDYDSYLGDETKICVTYKALTTSVKPGNIILCADGVINLKVEQILPNGVSCTILNNAKLGERKNVNLPGVYVDLPVLQEKDREDILKFGIPHGIDFVAASFVQNAADVKMIRETLGLRGRGVKIISKIENEEGLKNFDEILTVTDAVMVARGDLGMEIPPEKVFLAQKMMIAKCNLAGKPVITATQMMESCIANPRPTRAEASDVANAVLDGTDCVMLSGETANGAFPSETVQTMRRICEEAEKVIDYGSLFMGLRKGVMEHSNNMDTVEAVCCSAVRTAIDMNSPLILALTETGQTARMVAKYRPPQPIIAVTASETTARQLQCVRGVIVMLTASFQGTESVLRKALDKAKELDIVNKGDSIVAVHGQKEECAGQSNLMKVLPVP
ncbi:unnamed protein product [Amoebophrya sp. A120]|nr:unnamed protein product [Amoebophrya sp. A120]|eukprot:GSA120T00004937001.1